MGKLVKAKIRAPEAEVDVDVMFNPRELQVDKLVSWTARNSHAENPAQEFKAPYASTLSVTLHFDGYESRRDVYTSSVKEIEKTAVMVRDLGRPPLVTFSWGTFVFQGVTESLSQRYTMFLEDGTRVRCEVILKMRSAEAAIVGVVGGEGGATKV